MIELTSEQASILERATKSGMSPEEVLNQAFALIENQLESKDWMVEAREAIEAHLADGCAQADRRELLDPDEALRLLRERRAQRNVA